MSSPGGGLLLLLGRHLLLFPGGFLDGFSGGCHLAGQLGDKVFITSKALFFRRLLCNLLPLRCGLARVSSTGLVRAAGTPVCKSSAQALQSEGRLQSADATAKKWAQQVHWAPTIARPNRQLSRKIGSDSTNR